MVVFAFLVLASCGSDSNKGSVDGGLATGGFTKTFDTADNGNNSSPFNTGDRKFQGLYLASEIDGSGYIDTIRFSRGTDIVGADITCPNVTIKMGHTSLTALTTNFLTNVEEGKGSLQTVLSDSTVTAPIGAAKTWIDIPLSTPFNYNGDVLSYCIQERAINSSRSRCRASFSELS